MPLYLSSTPYEGKVGVFYVEFGCFSEGNLVRVKDFDGNTFAIELSGWFCLTEVAQMK